METKKAFLSNCISRIVRENIDCSEYVHVTPKCIEAPLVKRGAPGMNFVRF